jgi:hypothetical protein
MLRIRPVSDLRWFWILEYLHIHNEKPIMVSELKHEFPFVFLDFSVVVGFGGTRV